MWVKIKDFPNYEAHPDGMIRSLGARGKAGKVLKPQANNKRGGYLYITLCNSVGMQRKALHRVIAETFIPNPLGLPEVNHKTGDKYKCGASDLEWCTHQYNTQHAFATGLITNTGNRAVVQYGTDNVFIKEYASINQAAAELGIARQLISGVLRKQNQTTHGFVFVYKEVVL